MSIVEPERFSSRKFLTVVCPCGRALRAPTGMAGQQISCWECHKMVRVPVPHSPERAYRAVCDGLPDLLEGRWLALLAGVAAVATGVLCVPAAGVPLATLVLFLGAVGYGELIRQCGIDYWDFDDWKRPLLLVLRIGVAALFALAVAAPMLLSPGGFGASPRFSTLGLILGLVAAMVMPLAMFLTYARDDDGPLGLRRGAHVLLRYPVATLLALTLIPLAVVLCEFLTVVITSWNGHFRFLTLELYPASDYYSEQYKIPKYGNYTRAIFPDIRFFHLYFRRLHQGYSLTAALPASLSLKTFVMASPWTLELTDADYLRIRVIYTQIINMILFFFLGLQARWLGAMSTLESKQSLVEPGPQELR